MFGFWGGIYLTGLLGLLGACMGSFINCFAWRIVHGENVWRGRSHCATCNHTLGVLDLVPVLSWLLLRGRCRYCGEKISARYPATELVCGAVFICLVVVYGISVQALVYCVLACLLLAVALVDLDTMTIPNGFVVAGIIVWAASAWWVPTQAAAFSVGSLFAGWLGGGWLAVVADGLAGALGVGGFMLAASLVFDRVLGKQSLGGGDIKLLFMVGLFLGAALSVFNLLVSCLLGLVFATASKQWVKRENPPSLDHAQDDSSTPDTPVSSPVIPHEAKNLGLHDEETLTIMEAGAFPFGPAIAAATLVTLLVGPNVLEWYLSLFL
ncbi:MAG: prepilin peptidase [Raoultibacter sp.]